jgi:beta-glucosidase
MDNGTAAVSAAVAAAKAAETVVMFVGTNPIGNVVACEPGDEKCRLTTEAEAVDRVDITLPGVQSVLTQSVLRANPRTVLVMLNAGPLAIEWEAKHVPAIVEAYFPGELGGDAVAAVLMGDVSPAGRLPVTIYPPQYIQRNMTDYDLASGNGTTHLYYTGTPLWSFGFGLHYTTFAFGLKPTVDDVGPASGPVSAVVSAEFTTAGVAAGAETIAYSITVTNTGTSSSAVSVVALLSSEHFDSVTNEKLVDFSKTPVLRPGASTVVRLEVPKVR